MRIEGIAIEHLGREIAMLAASQTNYKDLKGLNGVANTKDLRETDGTRMLRENGWRGVDFYEVIRQLELSSNKRMVLMLLNRSDLLRLLLFLDRNQLVSGLNLFSKEKLLRLITLLPKEVLVRMLLHLIPMEELVSMMPTRELFAILRSNKLTERELVKGFQLMDPKFLQFIFSKITGQDASHMKQAELLAIFMHMKKRQILDGMEMLPFKALMPFVLFHVQNDPTLLVNLSMKFIMKLFDKMSKPTMLEAFTILPEALLIQFLSQLPDKFLVLVAEQVDDSVFEQYLLSEQPHLLAMLAGEMMAA